MSEPSDDRLAKIVTELEIDTAASRKILAGLAFVGGALFIASSFNVAEFTLPIKVAAEALIGLSIWVFWTTVKHSHEVSQLGLGHKKFPSPLTIMLAWTLIPAALATGVLLGLL